MRHEMKTRKRCNGSTRMFASGEEMMKRASLFCCANYDTELTRV